MDYLKNIVNYESKLNIIDTELAIKYIKDHFEEELSKKLNLMRVSAPLFVLPESGLNDYLNGHERVVKFDVLSLNKDVEIVQSLAKWKRKALKRYNLEFGSGIYTDMNAIRRDEELDAIHSVYVDQWDWEKVICKTDRTLEYLFKTVEDIYDVIRNVNNDVKQKFNNLSTDLPLKITFISTEELLNKYPHLNSKERENEITKEYKAVFIYQIGWPLSNGVVHDGRAADYDDWLLNGDILVWNDVLKMAFELSSMGIRVDKNSLVEQLKNKNELEKLDNEYCQEIMNDSLPLTIGGGIGQSRLCMFMLEKAHIGEVQVSVWSKEERIKLEQKNIKLL